MADATVQNFIDDFMTAANEAAARTALGLGTAAVANLNSMAVTGGTIDGTALGGTTPAAGTFTALAAASLNVVQGTLTDPATGLNLTATWNDAADTFTAIKANVTDTNSASASLLLDLQVGGSSVMSVSKLGGLTVGYQVNSPTYLDLKVNGVNKLGLGGATNVSYQPMLMNGYYLEYREQTAPSAPATNSVRVYAEDNGSGKTRLMALFATGAAQQIAIEP